jgi:hypothetical protein
MLALTLPATVTLRADEPAAQGYSYSGGDGASQESAVVVHAASEADGIRAEYAYLAAHWPGGHRGRQALLMRAGHYYDTLELTDVQGQEHTVYFDISEYFGR